ncbi:MAG: hypothetical protein PHC38_03065 [Weeksellaceae bacterium]|nr:hypothetical protein [Weeksellaceae bacterium]
MTEYKLNDNYMDATAQIAHLVFANTPNPNTKNQKSYFFPLSQIINIDYHE